MNKKFLYGNVYDYSQDIEDFEEYNYHFDLSIKIKNMTFSESFQFLLSEERIGLNLSNRELSKLCFINEKALRNYKKGKNIPSFQKLVLICLGLNLRPCISNELVSKIGINKCEMNKDYQKLYFYILDHFYKEDIQKVNEFVKNIYPEQTLI